MRTHLKAYATTLGQLSCNEEFMDVTVHCRNQIRLKTNRIVLSQSSILLRSIFQTHDPAIDLVCPDFNADAVEKVIELMNRGTASIESQVMYDEMKVILGSLQIDIPLQEDIRRRRTTTITTTIHEFLSNEQVDLDSLASGQAALVTSVETLDSVRPLENDSFNSVTEEPVHDTKNVVIEDRLDGQDNAVAEDRRVDEVLTKTIEEDVLAMLNSQMLKSEFDMGIEDVQPSKTVNNLAPEIAAPNKANNNQAYSCRYCDKTFGLIIALEKHQRKCHEENVAMTSNKLQTQVGDDDDLVAERDVINRGRGRKSSEHKKLFTPSVIDGKQSFQCPECDTMVMNYSSFIIHLMYNHFRSKLRPMYGAKEWDCGVCNEKSFSSEKALLLHLESGHGALSTILGTKNGQEQESDPSATTEEPKNDLSKNKEPSVRKYVERVPKKMNYQCPQCSTKTQCYSVLLQHLALHHFRKTLKKYFTQKIGECQMCSRVLSSQNALFYHLAVQHEALDKLIPDQKSMLISENHPEPGRKIVTEKSKSTQVISEELAEKLPGCAKMKVQKDNLIPSVFKKPEQLPDQQRDDPPAQVVSYYRCHLCNEINTDFRLLLKHMAKDHFRDEMREYYGAENGECHLCRKIMLNEDCLLLHLPVRHSALDRLIPSKEFLLVTDEEELRKLSKAELVSETPIKSSQTFNDFKMPKLKKVSANETPMKRPQKPSHTPSKKAMEENETPSKKLKTSDIATTKPDGFKTPSKNQTPKTVKKVETPKPKNA